MKAITISHMAHRTSVAEVTLLGIEMFRESRYSRLGFAVEKANRYAEELLRSEDHIAVGAFDGDQLVGMCVGDFGRVLPFSHAPVAIQHLFYLLPDYRGGNTAELMAKMFIHEARVRGAQDVVFSNGTGYEPEAVGRLFEHCGLRRIGGVYSLGE